MFALTVLVPGGGVFALTVLVPGGGVFALTVLVGVDRPVPGAASFYLLLLFLLLLSLQPLLELPPVVLISFFSLKL